MKNMQKGFLGFSYLLSVLFSVPVSAANSQHIKQLLE